MFAKDGIPLITGTAVLFLLSWALHHYMPHPITLLVTAFLGFLSVFNLFFFRDPDRKVPENPLAVISPADGKVVKIISVEENDYFNRQVQRISIFLSVFNVHVNRSPLTGAVDYFAYRSGKFLAAFNHMASEENEQTVIGISDTAGRRVLFKQIAGLIARRIVCHLQEGASTSAGERMGLIRYGSRVDVFVPLDVKVLVREGQRVRAGESILATFPEEGPQEATEKSFSGLPESEIESN